MKEKTVNIVVGCLEENGNKKCFKCKKKVLMTGDWKELKKKKFMCSECFKDYYNLHKSKINIRIPKDQIEISNLLLGKNYTKADYRRMIDNYCKDKKPKFIVGG